MKPVILMVIHRQCRLLLESEISAVIAQLVEPQISNLVVVSSSLIYRSMLMGVCNFNRIKLVIKTSGANAYDGALCKGELIVEMLRSIKSQKNSIHWGLCIAPLP